MEREIAEKSELERLAAFAGGRPGTNIQEPEFSAGAAKRRLLSMLAFEGKWKIKRLEERGGRMVSYSCESHQIRRQTNA